MSFEYSLFHKQIGLLRSEHDSALQELERHLEDPQRISYLRGILRGIELVCDAFDIANGHKDEPEAEQNSTGGPEESPLESSDDGILPDEDENSH